MKIVNLVIVDDDNIVCSSLKIILSTDPEIQVIAAGNSGNEAIALYEKYTPDVLLMDIRMEGMSGLEAGEFILKKYSEAKILFLTTFLDDDYIIKALSIGAKGYMIKQNFESIIPSIKAVNIGQNVYGTEIISKLPDLLKQGSSMTNFKKRGITDKEYLIIEQIAEGLSNKEIALLLYLGEGTVRNYISSILEKLDLRDRTQIAVSYYKNR